MNTYMVKQCGETHFVEADNFDVSIDRASISFYTTECHENSGRKETLVAGFWGIEMFSIIDRKPLELESKSK